MKRVAASLALAVLWLALVTSTHGAQLRAKLRAKRQADGVAIVDIPDVAGGTPPPTAGPFLPAPTTAPAPPDNNGFLFGGGGGLNFPDFLNFGNNGGTFPGGRFGGNVGGGSGGDVGGGFGGNAGGFGGNPGGVGGNGGGGFGNGGNSGGGFPGGLFGGSGVGGGPGGSNTDSGGSPSLPPTPGPITNNGGGILGGQFPPNLGNGGNGLGFPLNGAGGGPGVNPGFGDLFPGFGNNGNNNNNNTNNFNFPDLPPLNQGPQGNPFPGFPSRPRPPLPYTAPSTTTAPSMTYSICTPPVDSPLGDQVSNTAVPQYIQGQIGQELSINPQLNDFLGLAGNANDAPTTVDDSGTSDSSSCPTETFRATVFQRYGSNCWILQQQQPVFYALCKCNQCLAPTGFPQPPGSACEPFLLRTAVFAFCENFTDFTGQPRITQERIALPVTCRCRHASPPVTQSPSDTETPGGGETTPAATTPAPPNIVGRGPFVVTA